MKWVWVKIRYPNNWMVNIKLDIHICGPTSVFHFDPHPNHHELTNSPMKVPNHHQWPMCQAACHAATSSTAATFTLGQNVQVSVQTHMLHVWNTWAIFGVNVGKYSSTMEHMGKGLVPPNFMGFQRKYGGISWWDLPDLIGFHVGFRGILLCDSRG